MSMFTDWLHLFSEEEINQMKEESKKSMERRLINFENKRKNKEITEKDFTEIINYWSKAVEMNPQWKYPTDEPPWIIKCCKEIEICIGTNCFDIIF